VAIPNTLLHHLVLSPHRHVRKAILALLSVVSLEDWSFRLFLHSVSRCCLKRSAPPSANNALHSQQGSLQEIYEEVWPLELDEQALLELNEQRLLEMQGGARAVELNGHFNTVELQARADHQ